jgi:hypothetical protein
VVSLAFFFFQYESGFPFSLKGFHQTLYIVVLKFLPLLFSNNEK